MATPDYIAAYDRNYLAEVGGESRYNRFASEHAELDDYYDEVYWEMLREQEANEAYLEQLLREEEQDRIEEEYWNDWYFEYCFDETLEMCEEHMDAIEDNYIASITPRPAAAKFGDFAQAQKSGWLKKGKWSGRRERNAEARKPRHPRQKRTSIRTWHWDYMIRSSEQD